MNKNIADIEKSILRQNLFFYENFKLFEYFQLESLY